MTDGYDAKADGAASYEVAISELRRRKEAGEPVTWGRPHIAVRPDGLMIWHEGRRAVDVIPLTLRRAIDLQADLANWIAREAAK